MSTEIQTIARQAIANLEGRTRDRYALSDGTFDESGYAATLDSPGFATAACWYWTIKLELAYLHGDSARALEMAREAEKRLSGGVGQYFAIAELPFYTCLALAAVSRASPEGAGRNAEAFAASCAKLAVLSEQCSESYRRKWLLAQAERARTAGEPMEAVLNLYDDAIAAADASGIVWDWALANELCAAFLLAKEKPKLARGYMIDAHQGYRRWGAAAKVADLERRHPALSLRATGELPPVSTRTLLKLRACHGDNHELDARGADRCRHRDPRRPGLGRRGRDRQGDIAPHAHRAQSAGAERGALVLERQGQLTVEATFRLDPKEVQVGPPIALDEATGLAASVVNFVARTKEPLVIDDAMQDQRFQRDPYIVSKHPKSILCLVMTHQGRLTGILYLESNVATGTFSPSRIELLTLISAQAAIALENARLWANVEAVTAELRARTRRSRAGSERTEALREANERLRIELEERERAERARGALQENLLRVQRERLAELSTPLIPITDRHRGHAAHRHDRFARARSSPRSDPERCGQARGSRRHHRHHRREDRGRQRGEHAGPDRTSAPPTRDGGRAHRRPCRGRANAGPHRRGPWHHSDTRNAPKWHRFCAEQDRRGLAHALPH